MKQSTTFALLLMLIGCSPKTQFSNDEIILFNAGLQSNATLFYDINISSGNLGGLSGADTICQNNIPAAALALRHGAARAFLSAAATTEIRDMPSNWNIPTNVPVKSVTGTVLAQSWQGIVDASIDATLANAGVITNNANWWSGSSTVGAVGDTCTGWTSASAIVVGSVGLPSATDGTWMFSATNTCDTTTNNLLCLAFTSTLLPQTVVFFDGGAITTGNLGGRSGADATCLAAKPATISQSSVRAVLSVSAADDIADMPANYGISNVLNIRGPNGTTIASTWAELLDSSIDASLVTAGVLSAGTTWASGSSADGTNSGNNCSGWASDAVAVADAGDADETGASWITGTAIVCSGFTTRLLCVAF